MAKQTIKVPKEEYEALVRIKWFARMLHDELGTDEDRIATSAEACLEAALTKYEAMMK